MGRIHSAAVVVTIFSFGSWNAWITGHADAARERAERMQRVLERTQRNPFVTANVQMSAANLHALMLREFAPAEALAGEALASCEEHGFPDAAIWACAPLGLARAELGRAEEKIAQERKLTWFKFDQDEAMMTAIDQHKAKTVSV